MHMHILHLVSNISIRNGIMSVVMNYYRNIDKKKFTFDFLYFEDRSDNFYDEIKSLGGNCYKINYNNNINLFNQIRKFIKNNIFNYDIIHIHEIYLIGTFIGLKKYNSKIKIISHAHATKFSENNLKNIRNMLFSIPNIVVPDYYFACSKLAGIKLFGRKFKNKGYILNNAINLDNFAKNKAASELIRKKYKIEDKFVIGHVGNFNVQKNHTFLIDIFNCLCKINPNVVLLLVGDGNKKDEILLKIKKLNLEKKVIYLGVRNDVNKIMNAFDCFVLPSIYEGLGIVLIEAQAIGLPCVFSDTVPQEANIIKRQNRILSLNNSAEIWANEIINVKKLHNVSGTYEVRTAGYDIVCEAKKLAEKYKKIVEDN